MDARNNTSRSVSRSSTSRPVSTDGARGATTPQQQQQLNLNASAIEPPRKFASNSSLVLVGIRGAGKTSLGYIAARALGRRLVEADDEFERQTGYTRAQYLKNNGQNAEDYRAQERLVMESMLANYEKDAVIVCGVGSLEPHGQALLRRYSTAHPVVHVVRESRYIREWLRIPPGSELMRRLEESDRTHRTCSNFEFFNLFDGGSTAASSGLASRDETTTPGHRSPRYNGALQRTQEDFIRFINLIMGLEDAPFRRLATKISAARAFPADRIYTYALKVELGQLMAGQVNITELECGADAVELEIKASDIVGQSIATTSQWVTQLSEQFAILRRHIGAPIIFHINTNSFSQIHEGLKWWQDESYVELLRLGLRMGSEFVTIDLNCHENIMSQIRQIKSSTVIIGDYMDMNPSQLGWDDSARFKVYERGIRLGYDVIRMTQFASTDEDNIALSRFLKSATAHQKSTPLIAYNVGRLGRVSMCYNTILTEVTHDLFRLPQGSQDRQGLLTLQEASKLTYDLGLLEPLRFGLFGGNILYSLSPTLHNAGYQACGLPHHYENHQSTKFEDIDVLLNDPYFGGCSISLPFKTEVLKRVKSLSPEAQAIGAANTVIPIRSSRTDGSNTLESRAGKTIGWHGENTDWIGISTVIRQNLSPANLIRPWTSGLVVGAGGMARAAIYALLRLDVLNIFILNRTVSNAESVAAHFREFTESYKKASKSPHVKNIRHNFIVLQSIGETWPAEYEQPTIIVSCVPSHQIGSVPAPNFTLPENWLQSVNGGVIVENSYKPPLITPLLEQVWRLRETGRPWVPIHGLQVLPEQGIAQFQLMTGRVAPRHKIRQLNFVGIIEKQPGVP